MSHIAGSVPITGLIAPTDSTDIYPITDPIYGIDGLRSVVDHTTRDAISTQRRREGMLVYTQNDGAYWRLSSDMSTWVPTSLVVSTVGVQIDSHYGTIISDADGTTITFNLAASDKHQVTLGGNRTLSLTSVSIGQTFLIILNQDSTGSRTVAWFSGIRWAGGSEPILTTTAGKSDLFSFLCVSSGVYFGFVSGKNI